MAAVVVFIAPVVTTVAVVATWLIQVWRLDVLRRKSSRDFATQSDEVVVSDPARAPVMVNRFVQTEPVRFERGFLAQRTIAVQGPDTWMRRWAVSRRRALPTHEWGAWDAV